MSIIKRIMRAYTSKHASNRRQAVLVRAELSRFIDELKIRPKGGQSMPSETAGAAPPPRITEITEIAEPHATMSCDVAGLIANAQIAGKALSRNHFMKDFRYFCGAEGARSGSPRENRREQVNVA